ncbi:hypothetical protein ILUMI_17057 [Ignelater luminosus]|uniref:Uncharacterized protein n=1 Tax=Ignelater luminosus TaxID=2038154 RepID=A0A8K0CP21_IGNLU|nr:hypothetical protein ILUMI_17057 [Ignelater luminosus]
MKGLTSDKNASKTILLNSIGSEYFELLKLSVAPKEMGTLSFDEVIKSLDKQLTEKENALVERHEFLSETQGTNQSIPDFETKLFRLVETDYAMSQDQYNILEVGDVNKSTRSDSEKYYVYVTVGKKLQRFEVDSGAGHTLLPKSDFDKLNLNKNLHNFNIRFRLYTADIFAPIGLVELEVKHKNVKSKKFYMLFGLDI